MYRRCELIGLRGAIDGTLENPDQLLLGSVCITHIRTDDTHV